MDKTSGVLSFNNEIRNIHLQRNIGKYSQYKEELNPAIGDYYEIYTRPLKSLTEGKSLMAFTHDGTSEYSARINHNYLNDDLEGHHIYENNKPAFTNFWSGDFYNYLDYVMAVYGHETVPIQFIDGILSLNFMDKALELVEPGIVRDISPIASLAGVVKTNINNFSGTDTRLGLISNQMYAKSLVIGSLFNSDRERTESFQASVITPSLLTKYGNNETNINKLPNLMLPNHSDGRVVEDYNNDVYIYDDYNEALNVNLNTVRISDALKKNVNQPYISWTGEAYAKSTGNYYCPLGKYYYINYTDEPIKTDERRKYINMRTVDTDEFQNSDTREKSNSGLHQYDGKMSHIMYEDKDSKLLIDSSDKTTNQFDSFRRVTSKEKLNRKSLLYKTNEIFKDHKIHTIYGEQPVELPFGMGDFVSKDKETTTTDTAKTGLGRSRGRNLLKKKPDGSPDNGYNNPFCRVWTYHNQYDRVNKLVRPFTKDNSTAYDLREVQAMNNNHRAFIKGLNDDGGQYLADNTVLRKTGYVNITPSSTDSQDKVDIKKCMFSIENLAWKDVPDRPEILSREQRGPHGGRIMWFPPYDINFQENVNVNWDSNTFIGRGEKVYTYTNTERTGTLSFTLLIDHPSILNDLHNEAGQENPSYYDSNDTEDKTPDMEGDILRFFAGCKPLKYKAKKVEKVEDKRGEQEEKKDEIKKVKIYVFYPNDYSGHLNKPVIDGDADTDFAKYLICGKNVSIVNGNFVGYEINKDENNGISDLGSSDVITSCKQLGKNGQCVVEGDNEFRYRVDYDLRQNGLQNGNYEDTKSFGLNLDINVVKSQQSGNKSDADYTFAEFYYAMENVKKLRGATCDEYGMNFIKTKLSDETRLNEICKLFTVDCTFDKIVLRGGATKQDSGNSKKLAERRKSALKWYISDAYGDKLDRNKTEITTENVDIPRITYDKLSINDVKPKSERYAVIELQYKISDSQKLSDSDSNVSQTDDAVKHADAMHKLYEAMTTVSEVLQRYTNSGKTTEAEFTTWFETAKSERGDIEYSKIFTDDKIENEMDLIMESYYFYRMIYEYCGYVYKNQNTIEDSSVGYSKNINLSDSISNNNFNNSFKSLTNLVYTDEANKINNKASEITNDKSDIAEKQGLYDEAAQDLIDIRNLIKENCIKLNDYPEKSREYFTLISRISGDCEERNNIINRVKDTERNLLNSKEKFNNDLNTLERMYISKVGSLKEKFDKLNNEIKEINEKIVDFDTKIETKETEIENQERILDELVTETETLGTSNTAKINYRRIQITTLIQEKDKLVSDRNTVLENRQKKEDEIIKIFNDNEPINKVDNYIPSVGDTMELLNKFLSSDKYNTLYDQLKSEQPGGWEAERVFEYKDVTYDPSFNNLISGFVNHETTRGIQQDVRFWAMYALFQFIKWIELDVCKQNPENKTDNLLESVKHVLALMSEDDLVKYITYIVAKIRINDEPEIEFDVLGIPSDMNIINVDKFITEDTLKNTYKFVKETVEAPTNEMANLAVNELVGELNKIASELREQANQNMLAEGQTPDSGNLIISENNEEPQEIIVEDSASNNVLQLDVSSYKQNGHRYETESEYFSKLKDDNPIIFKQIKDKIKYFDPAFHSMSPEGFNARLTFLQQCTRQGHTIESQTSNEDGAPTAGNLAFGRMPICVLRIGDFIYSKIIINSMSISYGDGGMQWDLNPEGAGVQPMMAKVSMPITILGGQSLEGPINRLQDAVTFNYYANTGVYDNRSDRARPRGGVNEEVKTTDKNNVSQIVEGSEAAVSENKSVSDNNTNSRYRTEHYYTWNPMNDNKK